MIEITFKDLETMFDLICRFCLSDKDCCPLFLPDGNINQRLQKAFEIIASKVDENDGLPNNICGECLRNIESFVDFEADCSNSYQILMKFLDEYSEDVPDSKSQSLDCDSDHQLQAKSQPDAEMLIEDLESSVYIYNDEEVIPTLDPEVDQVAQEIETIRDDHSTATLESKVYSDTSEDEKSPTDSTALSIISDEMYIKACNTAVLDYCYRKNRKIPIVKCIFCCKTYRGRNTLRKHLKIHFQIKNYSCPFCERTFSDRTSLRMHETRHSNIKSFKCDQCERAYYSQVELKQHRIAKHGKRNHVCTVCNKRFSTKTILQDHELVHESDRLFVCSTCGKSFKRQRNLNRHYQIHEKAKPSIKCEPADQSKTANICQYCESMFEKPSKLLEHLTQEHPQEYEQSRDGARCCSICGTVCQDMEHYLLHQDTHVLLVTTAGGFQCVECGKQLRYRSLAEKHLQSHSTERTFQCNVMECSKKYKFKVHLIRHMRLAHPEQQQTC
ncbi:zinc finger protein 883-like [Anopheles maculipalpis]|uniref:zinc finger protein 883-like n=1 Tax=Anopheles maculipalpis TaxID=1496333 RepID=UPI0021594AC5|nr:zinc finger protein 883-like [Anopheles maculipalpis]